MVVVVVVVLGWLRWWWEGEAWWEWVEGVGAGGAVRRWVLG